MDPESLLGPKDRRSNEIRKLAMADSQFPMQFQNPHSGMPSNGFELFSMFGAPDPTSSRDSSLSQSTVATPKPLTKRQIEYRRLKESPEEYQLQLEKMRITRKNYYRRFRSNPVKWQEHLKRVAERRQNMPPDKIAQRLQKQREWRRANYMEARQDPVKWKEYLKKRSEERKRKKERMRNGEFTSDTSAPTSLNVTNSSNEEFGSPTDSQGPMAPKWNYYGFGSGSATPVSMKLQGPMDSISESALPFSLSVLLEPNVQVVEQEQHSMAGTSSGSFLNIPKMPFNPQITPKYEDYKPANTSSQNSGSMFPTKHHPHQQAGHSGSFHKHNPSTSTPSLLNGGSGSSTSSSYPKHSTPVHAHSSSSSSFNHKHSTPNHSVTHNNTHNGSFHKNHSSTHHQAPITNAHQNNSPFIHKQHQVPQSSTGLPNQQHHHHHNINNGAMFQDYLQKLTAGQQRTPTKQELPVPTPGYFDMNNMSQHFSQQYAQSPYRFTPTPQFAAYATANHVHEPVPRYQPEPPTPPPQPPQPKKLTRRQMELRRLKESPEKYREFLQKQRESRKKGYLKCREDPQKWQEHLVKVSEKRKQKKLETSASSANTTNATEQKPAISTQQPVDHKAAVFQQAAAAAASLAAVASGNLNLTHRMDGNLELSDHSLLPYALRTML